MKINKIINKLLYLAAIGASIFIMFSVIACVWIGFEVKNQCTIAKAAYGSNNCTQALSSLLDDENRSFQERNSAIWALGQLGEKEALPMLQKYYTGIIPNREPLNGTISQYELKKAINLANGGINISAFIWRSEEVE